MRPWAAFFSIWGAYLNWRYSVDAEGYQIARKLGKEIRPIETLDEQLAVLDGQVEVMPNTYSGLPLTVEAARQVNFTRKGWDTSRPTDANSGAWADGMLVAAHMRLEDFLGELGRYRRGQVNCDPQVANLLISGSYPLDDSERILNLLEVSLPVKVRRFTRYWVTVQARA